jgi:hypothetical protein
VHVRLGDILDDNWNIIVPTSDGLIVRCRDESSIVVHECNGVDWPKMLIIGLHDLMSSQVILNLGQLHRLKQTYLDDLLVLHTREKDVLLVSVWVEFDNIWYLAIRERLYAFSGFGIPEFDMFVVRCRQELGSLVVEGDIFDSLRMSKEGTKAVSLVVDVPKLLTGLAYAQR